MKYRMGRWRFRLAGGAAARVHSTSNIDQLPIEDPLPTLELGQLGTYLNHPRCSIRVNTLLNLPDDDVFELESNEGRRRQIIKFDLKVIRLNLYTAPCTLKAIIDCGRHVRHAPVISCIRKYRDSNSGRVDTSHNSEQRPFAARNSSHTNVRITLGIRGAELLTYSPSIGSNFHLNAAKHHNWWMPRRRFVLGQPSGRLVIRHSQLLCFICWQWSLLRVAAQEDSGSNRRGGDGCYREPKQAQQTNRACREVQPV
jgi:hypothetical protein